MAYKKFVMWAHPFIIATAAMLSALIIASVQAFGPEVEGYFFPVAKAYDVSVESIGSDHVRIEGRMRKVRECSFVALEAVQKGIDGNTVTVPLQVRESVKLRPEGDFEWGPWILDLPVWQLNNNLVEIYVYHKCHSYYLTKTVFYRDKVKTPTPPFVPN